MVDPYAALGLTKAATQQEIKDAYRRIARRDHPDLNPDDPDAEARFKAASAAHDLLRDPAQRARFDAGEIDASGAEQAPRGFYRDHAGGPGDPYSQRSRSGRRGPQAEAEFEGFDADEFFSRFARAGGGVGGGFGRGSGGGFGGGGGDDRSSARFEARGADVSYALSVPFLDAVRGAGTRITLPEGDALEVTIPAGAADGTTLRLRGKGQPGFGEGPPGDALVTLRVIDDPQFARDGDDILSTLAISIDEAILGGKVPVATIDGPVSLNVPSGASSGQVLRLRGRGVARRGPKGQDGRGDHRVTLRIAAPPEIDEDLRAFFSEWRKTHGYDPRRTKGDVMTRTGSADIRAAITIEETVERVGPLTIERLRYYEKLEVVRPLHTSDGPRYREIDVARLALLCDLTEGFEVNEDALVIIVSLIDQLHGARARTRAMIDAIAAEPPEVRLRLARATLERHGLGED